MHAADQVSAAYPSIVAFCGNNQRPSKSRALVEAIVEEMRPHGLKNIDVFDLIDLGDFGIARKKSELGPAQLSIVNAIEQADALIIGTPVYKGSYTGMFKHVIDLLDQECLQKKPVCITACGGGYKHALVVEHQLRPLFGFFNALALPTAVYAGEQDFTEGRLSNALTIERARAAADEMAHFLHRH